MHTQKIVDQDEKFIHIKKAIHWSISTQPLDEDLDGHVIYCLAFNIPFGNLIAIADTIPQAKIWNCEQAKFVHVLIGHENTIWNLEFNPQSTLLATGSDDFSVRLWIVATGELYALLRCTSEITSLQFNSSGDELITNESSLKTRIWNVRSGNCIHMIKGENDFHIFCPDGSLCVSSTCRPRQSYYAIYDVKSGKSIYRLKECAMIITAMCFNTDGTRLLIVSGGRRAILYNIQSKKNISQFDCGLKGGIRYVTLNRSGNKIFISNWELKAKIFDDRGNVLQMLDGCNDEIYCFYFTTSGDIIIKGCSEITSAIKKQIT